MAYQHELQFVFSNPLNAEEVKWTDEEIGQLRLYVLKRTLSSVKDGRTGLRSRTEAIEWMMDESNHPFSYVTCCIDAGFNPYTLRDLVIDSIKRNNKGR